MDNLDIKGQNCTIWRKTDTFENRIILKKGLINYINN